MPALTPNRSYPYPVAADPVDIPGDLQRFAESVDHDVCELQTSIPRRPAIRIRGTDPVLATSSPPLNPDEQLPFEVVDFDTGIPYLVSTGTTAAGGLFWIFYPQLAGFYQILGTVAIPRPDGTSRAALGVRIYRENGALVASNLSHLQPSASDGIRTGAVAMGVHLNGSTQGVGLNFFSRTPAGGLDQMTVGERTLTLVRMSPTYP